MALADRLLPSEAMDLVSGLVKAFPNGGANAGGGYLGALAAVLCEYPRMVATKCCHPVKGVARETKFLPTVADLVGWCERETADMRKPVEREDYESRILREAAERREDDDHWRKARAVRPSLDNLRAKHGPNWGLRGRDHEPGRETRHAEAIQRANNRAWARMPGGTVSAGIPITQALLDGLSESGKAGAA